MFRFEKIEVWQKAMAWAQKVYQATGAFPSEKRFGLTAQLRRAAVSVPSNIAEGSGRGSHADFARFLEMAYGSLMEAVCQCHLAKALGYMEASVYHRLYEEATEIARMLSGLRAYLLEGKPSSDRVREDLASYHPEVSPASANSGLSTLDSGLKNP